MVSALIIIDMQRGVTSAAAGPRNNRDAERNHHCGIATDSVERSSVYGSSTTRKRALPLIMRS
jgi:hypothetical protein